MKNPTKKNKYDDKDWMKKKEEDKKKSQDIRSSRKEKEKHVTSKKPKY